MPFSESDVASLLMYRVASRYPINYIFLVHINSSCRATKLSKDYPPHPIKSLHVQNQCWPQHRSTVLRMYLANAKLTFVRSLRRIPDRPRGSIADALAFIPFALGTG